MLCLASFLLSRDRGRVALKLINKLVVPLAVLDEPMFLSSTQIVTNSPYPKKYLGKIID
jgi:hypothetical protein